jgi:propionyl-CoA carboxylase alpha chain
VTATWTGVVHRRDDTELGVELDGRRVRGSVLRGPAGAIEVTVGGARVALTEVPRFPTTAERPVAGATRAPMPGAVVDIAVEVGSVVEAGALLVTVEAMKMEHRVVAEIPGTVSEVAVAPGDSVTASQLLVVVEPDEDADVSARLPGQ